MLLNSNRSSVEPFSNEESNESCLCIDKDQLNQVLKGAYISVKSKYLLLLNKTVKKTIRRHSSIYPAGCAMFGPQEPSMVLGLYLVPWQIKSQTEH